MTIKDIIGFYCTHTPLFHYLSNCTWQKAIGSRYSNNESSHAINGSIISWHQCIFIIRIQRNYQLKVQCNVDNIPIHFTIINQFCQIRFSEIVFYRFILLESYMLLLMFTSIPTCIFLKNIKGLLPVRLISKKNIW